jgi:hypothetical protein
MRKSRSRVVSSFTIIKGAFIEKTYTIFQTWDFSLSCPENLQRVKETNVIGATSQNWLRDVAKVLNRRFDTAGRDRHAISETEPNAHRLAQSPDWHMYLMDAADVEREILRLHQFHKVHYQIAGSLAQLKLPCDSSADYARELVA